MSSELYDTGVVSVVNGSQVVIGSASCDWANEISTPAIFKIDLSGESTFSIDSVVSATRILLAANYNGSTNSGLSYNIGRSFTLSRSYWRVLTGDSDWAEILSQETIDKIDEDIDHIMTGDATVDGTISTSFGIDTDGNTLRIQSTNLSASRQYHFPDYNASIPSRNASQDWLETQRFNILTASNLTASTADIETGDVETLHTTIFTASNINATVGDIETMHITTLTTNNVNATTGSVAASLDVGGLLGYGQTTTASALMTASIGGNASNTVSGQCTGWIETWDNVNATMMYIPYWHRG